MYSREHELKEELEKLKLKKSQLGAVRTTVDEYDSLIKDIGNLIVILEDKINKLELKNKMEMSNKIDANNINFFDTQIQFLADKERVMEESIKKAENQVDKAKLKIKSGKTAHSTNNEKESEDKVEMDKNKNEGGSGGNNNNNNESANNNRLIKVSEIISRVNTELQFHKHVVLNGHLKLEEETKKKDYRVKKLKEYIKTFEKAIQLTNNKIDSLMTKSSVSDVHMALVKIDLEIPNFTNNSLEKLDKINDDSNSLLSKLSKAMTNLEDLEEKIGNIGGDHRSTTVIKINDMFHRNIMLAKQNNILMSKVVNSSQGLYNKLLEKIIRNDNPPNFNELKEKIDNFKLNGAERERDRERETPTQADDNSDREDDLKAVHSDESFNY